MQMRLFKKEAGVTLIEILVSIGLLGALFASVATMVDQFSKDTKDTLVAQHVSLIGKAANAYIKDNYTTVAANATATTPALITVPMLTAAGYLQSGFQATNGYNQTACVLVLEPSAGKLSAMAITEGGTAINDLSLGQIAGGIGAAGGGVYSTDATTFRGTMGQWSLAVGNFANANNLGKKCDGSAGTPVIAAGHPIMALWFENGDSTVGFLYRDAVPGRPELNTMNTPLVMAATNTVGAACTTAGAIARTTAGAVISCQGGQWKGGSGGLNWKGTVATPGVLPASGNTNGDAYRVSGVGGHAFVWDSTSGVWQGMVVDSSGNLTLAGAIYTSGGSSWYGAITMQGSKNGWSGIDFRDAGGAMSGTLMMHPSYSGFYRADWGGWRWYVDENGNSIQPGSASIGGSATIYGSATVSGNVDTSQVQVNSIVAENTACPQNGRVARDATGLLLSCQSGIWKKASGGSGGFFSNGNGGFVYGNPPTTICTLGFACIRSNARTGACSCPAGSSAVVVTVSQNSCDLGGVGIPATTTSTIYTCE